MATPTAGVFLIRTALLKYRFRLPGFDLPEPVKLAQEQFDAELAKVLDGMADRMEGKSSQRNKDFIGSVEHLDRTIRTCCSEKPQEMVVAQFGAFLSLIRRIEGLTRNLLFASARRASATHNGLFWIATHVVPHRVSIPTLGELVRSSVRVGIQ